MNSGLLCLQVVQKDVKISALPNDFGGLAVKSFAANLNLCSFWQSDEGSQPEFSISVGGDLYGGGILG